MSNQKKPLMTAPGFLMPWEEAKRLIDARSDATMYKYIALGFPAPLEISPRRTDGAVGKRMFVRTEVEAWIKAKLAERDAAYGRGQPA
ncbi:hypothetical protein PPTS312_28630 [Pseudomonas putida]|uniref:AlpA family phage regulatory protein n=1 Tax=Pseudomonas putida TaxID=303 RepID=A0A7U6M2V2_PSEPU|nr:MULTISPECIES: hypothetical protein [Pseudomonas]MDD2124152.1 hypothetical protein [Pseudomonas monteilii]MDD2135661.1 hypothetical protein [Pseudomonas kurunegalensis]BBU44948.1 hypothetical protein PPTS312_28630 [Pseudomonas putida]